MKRNFFITVLAVTLLIIEVLCVVLVVKTIKDKKITKEEVVVSSKDIEEKHIQELNNTYNELVVIEEDTHLYLFESSEKKVNDLNKEIKNLKFNKKDYKDVYKSNKLYETKGKYIKDAVVHKGAILELAKIKITSDVKYFKVIGLDKDYYVEYDKVTPYKEKAKNKLSRYKKYIPFNKNVVIDGEYTLYQDDKAIYTFNGNIDKPIYIIDGNKYYIEYNEDLYYVLKEDIKEIKDSNNSNAAKAYEITTLVYHFIYDPSKGEGCNESICHTVTQVQSHIDYVKNNGFLTITLDEFELWIDGKINLPKKTVVFTLDDGAFAWNAAKLFPANQEIMNAFIVTGWFPNAYNEWSSEYMTINSHGHAIHDGFECPGGLGGAIRCRERTALLADLVKSRELTGNSKHLCYPFYEFNDYSISVAKEAGFTMGYAGYYETGTKGMRIGGDKFKIPRVTLSSSSTVDYVARMINYY